MYNGSPMKLNLQNILMREIFSFKNCQLAYWFSFQKYIGISPKFINMTLYTPAFSTLDCNPAQKSKKNIFIVSMYFLKLPLSKECTCSSHNSITEGNALRNSAPVPGVPYLYQHLLLALRLCMSITTSQSL